MIEWMGRYRPIVAALVKHVNSVSRSGDEIPVYGDIYLTPNEWQVLEYIVEHREDDEHMNNMINSLAIPQSSFSRIQKKLYNMGLIERFQTLANRKNIILKPTELAMQAYDFHSKVMYETMFKPFFDELACFSDEEIEKIAHALETLSFGARKDEFKTRSPLVKLE